MKWIWDTSQFVRSVRCRMRFGELSRAPLKLLRLELRESDAHCEWLLRRNDAWDRDLPKQLQEGNQAEQGLRDAIRLREFLFALLPEVKRATVEGYREHQGGLELTISGILHRSDKVAPKIVSLGMRAKLYGFRFCLEDGVLQPLQINADKFVFSD